MHFPFAILSLILASGSVLAASGTALDSVIDSEQAHPMLRYSLLPGAAAPEVKQVDVVATEFYSDADAEAFASQLKVDSVSIITPEGDREPASLRSIAKIRDRIQTRVRQRLPFPVGEFPEWFGARVKPTTILQITVLSTTGYKFTEALVSGMPLMQVATLVPSLITSGVLGAFTWKFADIATFISTQGTPVKKFIEGVASVARSARGKERVATALTTAWKLTKTIGLNYATFGVLKFSIYASSATDGSLDQQLIEAYVKTFNGGLWTNSIIASFISYPTTELIVGYSMRAMARVGNDAAKLKAIKTTMMAMLSSAMTYRGILFSSLLMSKAIHSPALTVTAGTALGAAWFGSLVANGSFDRVMKVFRPSLASQEDCAGLATQADDAKNAASGR